VRTERSPDSSSWCLWRWFFIRGRQERVILSRLTLLRTPWFQVMLHWIHHPDGDRDLHDHPWRFLSLVLWGSYWELTGKVGHRLWPQNLLVRRVRWLNWKGLRDAHRIALVGEGGALTLVVTGRKRKSWSFHDLCTGEETPWREYLARPRAEVGQ